MVSRHWHDQALQRMQQQATPEAMRLPRSTVEHPFATMKCHIDRGADQVREKAIQFSRASQLGQHLRSSSISATRSSRATSRNEAGSDRLQLETYDEHSRSTMVGRCTGYSLNGLRRSVLDPGLFNFKNAKSDVPELGNIALLSNHGSVS